jgi:catechol 2,3-dioxygenase
MGPQGSSGPIATAPDPIGPNVRIGHTHLRTADIDRLRDFYLGVLGFDVIAEERDVPGWARPATSCSSRPAGITTTWGSTRGSRSAGHPRRTASRDCTHVALAYPTR